jgi:hypothetical protein
VAVAISMVVAACGVSPIPSIAQSGEDQRAAFLAAKGACPLHPQIASLDDTLTRYAISLFALNTGVYSGTVSLYSGNERFDVNFSGMSAAGNDDHTARSSAIVVRFPNSTRIDGALVTALTRPQGVTCRVPYAPWTPDQTPTGPQQDAYVAGMRRAFAISAPPPVSDPRPCSTPDHAARTISAAEPDYPGAPQDADVTLTVLVDDHDAVVGTWIDTSSGAPALDAAALEATSGSAFQSASFRCKPVIAFYRFIVSFRKS